MIIFTKQVRVGVGERYSFVFIRPSEIMLMTVRACISERSGMVCEISSCIYKRIEDCIHE